MIGDPGGEPRPDEGTKPRADASPPHRFDVFISFCSEDRRQAWFGGSIDVVAELKTALERYRHPDQARRLRVCTYDEDFELGEEVRRVIAATIEQSATTLFLSTKRASASAFVHFELERALAALSEGRVMTALVDQPPNIAFPALFGADVHAADLSAAGCPSRRAWRHRIELEAAKIAARVWQVPLERVRDRFLIERRRRRRWTWTGAGSALATVAVAVGLGLHQHGQREAARVLGIHQRYAAAMATVQRAWTAGHVDLVRATLAGYQERVEVPDPRSFEWHTYGLVATAERLALGQFGDRVTALAVAPDRPWFAFATEKQRVAVFDAETGAQVAVLSSATIATRSLEFSPAGWLAAVAGSGVVLWDRETRKETVIAAPRARELTAIAIVPASRALAAVDRQGSLYRLDGGGFKLLGSRLFEAEAGLRLAFSESGRFLVGASTEGKVRVVDASRFSLLYEKQVPEWQPHDQLAIRGEVAVIPTAERLSLLDLATGRIRTTWRVVNGLRLSGVATAGDGQLVAVGDPSDQSIVLWQAPGDGDAHAWREIGSVKGYRGWINAIHFLPRSTRMVSSSLAGDVSVWELARMGHRIVHGHSNDIAALAFADGTNDVISLDREGTIRRWDALTSAERWARMVGKDVAALAFRGPHVAVAADGAIHMLRIEDGAEEGSLPGWGPLASTADGSVFAYLGEGDGEVLVEDRAAGTRRTLHVEPEAGADQADITSISLVSGGDSLLLATADGRVMRFDLHENRLAFVFAAHGRVIHSVLASPDGSLFATSSSDRMVRIWRTATGEPAGVLEGHAATVQALAFSTDGKTLASGAQDGVIKLWNLGARLETVTFYAHQRDLHPGVTALAFSADGAHLVSGGALGTVIVWDADPRDQIDELSRAAR